ncbi:MAG: hypothetical protein CSA84_00220 [Actinomycetales bacterium]|nr:MAG: hypothetical protein CSA84_00220 [Actinomycetales bacterium]
MAGLKTSKRSAAVDLEHPRLAGSARLLPPRGPGAGWIVQCGVTNFFRVSPAFAEVATRLDGKRSVGELAAELGSPWTVDHVSAVVSALHTRSLLDDGTRPAKPSRVRFALPMTVQVTVLDPARILRWSHPLIRVLLSRSGRFALSAVAVVGLILVGTQWPDVWAALGAPLPATAYLVVLVAVLLTTALHEFGHGAVLTYHGGRPSRMGFMLFYLAPTFFCDVSDGWRLPRPAQRVQVALAGVATQAVVGGLAAIGASGTTGQARATLLVLATATYVGAVINLVPFVKFDGYIALMSALDVPNLRHRAMADARAATAAVFFGGRRQSQLPQLSWAVPYGLACLLFPWLLVGTAAAHWLSVLGSFGPVGLVAMACATGGALFVVGRGLVRLVQAGRSGGAPIWRLASVTSLLVAFAAAALVLLQVPISATGGYYVANDGTARIVLSKSLPAPLASDDLSVTFLASGVVARTPIAQGDLVSVQSSPGEGPVGAVLPIASDTVVHYDTTYAARTDRPLVRPTGLAVITGSPAPLYTWLYITYVAPVLP